MYIILKCGCGLETHGLVVIVQTTMFNIEQFYVLPTQCLYMFCMDLRTKQRSFPYKALMDWILLPSAECVYRAVRNESLNIMSNKVSSSWGGGTF